MATDDKTPIPDLKRVSLESSLSKPSEQQHPSIALPLSFRAYCEKVRATYSVFYIGRTKSERLNAISVNYTRWTHAVVSLHEGPSVDSPILGKSVHNGKTIDVSLPNGSFQMTGDSSRGSFFIFTIPVGADDKLESFEWRRSSGEEVKSLGGRGTGWELVRISTPDSDKEEIVAVHSVNIFLLKLSGRFEFLGSGATEELGRNWAIMAVVTALALGQKQRDTATMTLGIVAS